MDEPSADPQWLSATEGFFRRLGHRSSFPDSQAKKGAHSNLLTELLNVDRVERGRVSFFFTVDAPFRNHFDVLHGGAVASLVEEVSATCLKTVAGDAEFFLGELAVSYLSAAKLNVEVEQAHEEITALKDQDQERDERERQSAEEIQWLKDQVLHLTQRYFARCYISSSFRGQVLSHQSPLAWVTRPRFHGRGSHQSCFRLAIWISRAPSIHSRTHEPLLESLLEACTELQPLLHRSHERLKDLFFFYIALDSTVKTVIERGYEDLNNSGAEKVITLVLENLSTTTLEASTKYLGGLLGVEQWVVNIFTEEIIRAGSAASLSSLLNWLDPFLQETAHLGRQS
ncbi:hypothetical protein H6P81_008391 [Aristolochia fimbriata]|uniref:Thioesterase domain-containing protein n=1 Tax=Aristolochia fimbriata TaxID=158543 RepID=A0AAV7F660_ARIFI|nr:hypothetical protein H6P81_008391 [Aristolochia fimbriata]